MKRLFARILALLKAEPGIENCETCAASGRCAMPRTRECCPVWEEKKSALLTDIGKGARE